MHACLAMYRIGLELLTRWLRPRVVASVAIGLLAIAGTVLVGYAANYAPLQNAGWGGTAPGSPAKLVLTSTSSHIAGPAGTEVHLLMGVHNTGPVAVRVVGVELNDVVRSASWSMFHLTTGGSFSGDERPWQPFSAALPSHGTIRLKVAIRQLDCALPASRGRALSAITVRWHALGIGHTTRLPLMEPIELCSA